MSATTFFGGLALSIPSLAVAVSSRSESRWHLIGVAAGAALCFASLTVAPCLPLALDAAAALEVQLARRRSEDA